MILFKDTKLLHYVLASLSCILALAGLLAAGFALGMPKWTIHLFWLCWLGNLAVHFVFSDYEPYFEGPLHVGLMCAFFSYVLAVFYSGWLFGLFIAAVQTVLVNFVMDNRFFCMKTLARRPLVLLSSLIVTGLSYSLLRFIIDHFWPGATK